MIFVTLVKWRKRFTKEMVAESDKLFARLAKEGGKVLAAYWTLGRYDAIVITEAPDEKTAMRALMRWGDLVATETLVAIPRDQAIKLVE